MKKKSLFGKIADALRDADEESAEDIDKEVEAAVADIANQTVTSIDADTVFHSQIGKAGDTVFVMDLDPIFAIIGGVTGRAAQGLLECCDRIFRQQCDDPLDRGVVEVTKFIMRFTKLSDEQGFQRAAMIVNEIGIHVLSDRFNTMEVPDILIAADAGDITNADGTLDTSKLDAAIASGGKPVTAGVPSEGDPEWVKLRYLNKAREQQLIAMKGDKDAARNKGPEWVEGKGPSTLRIMIQRNGRDRRSGKKAIISQDNRSGQMERRGRGY